MDVSPLIRDRPGTGFEYERFPTLPRFLIGICCYSFPPCRFPSQIFRTFSLLAYVFVAQYHLAYCARSFLRSLIRACASRRKCIMLKYRIVDFKNYSFLYGTVFEISVLQLYNDWKILSSSYFWRIVPFVRFFLYTKVEETSWTQPFSPQLTASRPGKLLTLSHRKHVWKCILDAIDKPFKPVFVAEDTKKEIAEQNRINVLIVSRENLV